MTVAELIVALEKLSNKEIKLLIDCPHCGHSNELLFAKEFVVLGTKEPPNEPK